MRYWTLQEQVYQQEIRNLTLHEELPSAVLNFEFLASKRGLVLPITNPAVGLLKIT